MNYLFTTFLFAICVFAIKPRYYFHVDIEFDNYDDETSWTLSKVWNGKVMKSSTTSDGRIIPSEIYEFRIEDSYGDGLCCSNGNGKYSLKVKGTTFFTSTGDFGAWETVMFKLKDNGSVALWKVESEKNPRTQYQIVLNKDSNPEETSWTLSRSWNGKLIKSSTSNAQGYLKSGKYEFTIKDSGKNGLCCQYGNGGYDLRANNFNFYSSDGKFGAWETVKFQINDDRTAQVLEITRDPTGSPTTPNPDSGFNIDLVEGPESEQVDDRFLQRLQLATERWSKVIVGDLPNINGIDDLQITYEFKNIDGRYGTLGYAGPRRFRAGSLLPYTGIMVFDTSDISFYDNAGLDGLFLHEIGHILGIGTLWEYLGCSTCPDEINYNSLGGCPNAVSRFEASSGRSPGSSLRIEDSGGSGTVCGHWDEAQLQSELMTGYFSLNPDTGISELSKITIGTLEDMGYQVDYSQADAFSIPASSFNSMGLSAESVDLTGDISMPDEIVLDPVDSERLAVWEQIEYGDDDDEEDP